MTARDGRPIGSFGSLAEEHRKTERDMTNHTPSLDTQSRMGELRVHFMATAVEVIRSCPEGREKSLALTKLEESLMWSMAAMARGDYDHKLAD